MAIFYSKTTGGFYDTGFASYDLPADAVEIGAEQHSALLAAQASGKVIQAASDGTAEAVTPTIALTVAQQAQALLLAGLTVTTTGTLALSAVALATNAAAQSKIVAVMTAVNTTGVFPSAAASWYLLKQDGSLLSGLTLVQYKALATAILDFVAACDLVIDGASTTLPTAAATVATA